LWSAFQNRVIASAARLTFPKPVIQFRQPFPCSL
jgi:hypothetical protein